MTCPSLLTCSRYADGALPREQAAPVERHLAGCISCRARVAGLAAESRALRTALRGAEVLVDVPAFAAPPTIARQLSWLGWATLAAAVVNVAWMSLATGAGVPLWLAWLAPDPARVVIDVAIALILQTAAASGDLYVAALRNAGWVAGVAVGAAGLWLLARRRLHRASTLGTTLCLSVSVFSVLITVAPAVHAFEVRRAEERVIVAAGEIVDDTLVVMAKNVLVEGTVTGDLIAMGERVSVRGRVGGALLAAAETLSLEGEVAGSVLAMGETVDIRGAVFDGNVYGAGRAVTVRADTRVAGNLALAAAEAEVHGTFGRDLLALAQHFTLFGNVERGLRAYGERVDVAASAHVGGDLTARVKSADHLQVADGATVEGKTSLSTWPEEPSKYVTFEYYLGVTVKFLAAFVTGLVLFQAFPALRVTRLDGAAEVLTVTGLGALALIATPALALAAALTVIGAPLGILAFLLWLAALYAAGIVTAGHVGRLLLKGDANGLALPLLLGLALLFVLIHLPLVGGPVRLAAIVVGLGLMVQWLRRLWAARATSHSIR